MTSYQQQLIWLSGLWCRTAAVHCVEVSKLSAMSCREALGKGRYTWRHNQVLAKLVEAIEVSVEAANGKALNRAPAKMWVKEGSKLSGTKPSSTPAESILNSANDWKITTDLPGKKAA